MLTFEDFTALMAEFSLLRVLSKCWIWGLGVCYLNASGNIETSSLLLLSTRKEDHTSYSGWSSWYIAKLSRTERLLLKISAWLEKDPEKKLIMKNGFDYMDRNHLDDIIAQIQRLAGD